MRMVAGMVPGLVKEFFARKSAWMGKGSAA